MNKVKYVSELVCIHGWGKEYARPEVDTTHRNTRLPGDRRLQIYGLLHLQREGGGTLLLLITWGHLHARTPSVQTHTHIHINMKQIHSRPCRDFLKSPLHQKWTRVQLVELKKEREFAPTCPASDGVFSRKVTHTSKKKNHTTKKKKCKRSSFDPLHYFFIMFV